MDKSTDSLPPELRCTGQKLSDDGAYVVGKCCHSDTNSIKYPIVCRGNDDIWALSCVVTTHSVLAQTIAPLTFTLRCIHNNWQEIFSK